MTRLTLAALALVASVTAAAAFPFVWTPSVFPQPGSFGDPGIVSQDESGK